jgi:hypothetical protein
MDRSISCLSDMGARSLMCEITGPSTIAATPHPVRAHGRDVMPRVRDARILTWTLIWDMASLRKMDMQIFALCAPGAAPLNPPYAYPAARGSIGTTIL